MVWSVRPEEARWRWNRARRPWPEAEKMAFSRRLAAPRLDWLGEEQEESKARQATKWSPLLATATRPAAARVRPPALRLYTARERRWACLGEREAHPEHGRQLDGDEGGCGHRNRGGGDLPAARKKIMGAADSSPPDSISSRRSKRRARQSSWCTPICRGRPIAVALGDGDHGGHGDALGCAWEGRQRRERRAVLHVSLKWALAVTGQHVNVRTDRMTNGAHTHNFVTKI